MKDLIKKAQVLVEALPYMRKFYQKTFVFKYGGKVKEKGGDTFCEDIVLLQHIGIRPVVVHGGGPQITKVLERVGIESKFEKGIRITDDETMEWVEAVLQGQMNKELVREINRLGGRAIGLSGSDGNLIVAERVKNKKLGRVGEVRKINVDLINSLIEEGYIPVISPVGVDKNGVSLNINADTVAAEIAVRLKAEKFFLLTDVDGVLDENKRLIPSIKVEEVKSIMKKGFVQGGMIPKLECCSRAVKGGVKKAHIINGEIEHAILLEIFTHKGIGTEIIP
jgi:acetylglutamate kinase